MTLHRGINTTSVTGEGLDGLPGLLIAIAFPMLFAGIFMPSKWFMVVFLAVEAGAAILYLLSKHRDRRARKGSRLFSYALTDRKGIISQTGESKQSARER